MVKLIIGGTTYAVKNAATAAKIADLMAEELKPINYIWDSSVADLNGGNSYFHYVDRKLTYSILSNDELDDLYISEEHANTTIENLKAIKAEAAQSAEGDHPAQASLES